jgi:hypothetical protein
MEQLTMRLFGHLDLGVQYSKLLLRIRYLVLLSLLESLNLEVALLELLSKILISLSCLQLCKSLISRIVISQLFVLFTFH